MIGMKVPGMYLIARQIFTLLTTVSQSSLWFLTLRRAEKGQIDWLNLNMLPHGYIDPDWAETPEDTLKHLTGPKQVEYMVAWQLTLFPRIANPDDYAMIYKEISKIDDKRKLLYQVDPDDASDGFDLMPQSQEAEQQSG